MLNTCNPNLLVLSSISLTFTLSWPLLLLEIKKLNSKSKLQTYP